MSKLLANISFDNDREELHFEMSMNDREYFIAMRDVALRLVDKYVMEAIIERNTSNINDEAIKLFIKSIHLDQKIADPNATFALDITSDNKRRIYLDEEITFSNKKMKLPRKGMYFGTIYPNEVIKIKGSIIKGNVRNDGYLFQIVGNFGMKQNKDTIFATIQTLETYSGAEVIKKIGEYWLNAINIAEKVLVSGGRTFGANDVVDMYILMPLVSQLQREDVICMCNDNKTLGVVEFIYDGPKELLLATIDTYKKRVTSLI